VEDAVKRLNELTIDQKRIRKQLHYTRRLLKKEKDSCFIKEDDECLQNLMTDAAQYVTDNKNVSVATLLCAVLEENRKELSPNERNEREISRETVAECKKLAEELVIHVESSEKTPKNY
jgi:hypothetical protein